MKIPKSLSLERKKRAWEMHLQFYKHHEIAEELNMTQPAVTKMLHRMNKQFQKSLESDIERVKLQQIAQLELIFRKAMESFEVSKRAVRKLKTKTVLGVTENSSEASYQQVSQDPKDPKKLDHSTMIIAGDSKYLTEARNALADIRKIKGYDAPIKWEGTMNDLTDDELINEAKKIIGEEKVKEMLIE